MTLPLNKLKERYEGGDKQRKDINKEIAAQLRRVCGYKECDESLAFERIDKRFCCESHKVKEKTRLRTENRAKKRLYNERHGITRKTIKRDITPGVGVDPAGYEIIYENYKEPLKSIPTGVGYGYYGTIATTADHTLIQCHICGELFRSLGLHVRKHKVTAADYKQRFQLKATAALVSDEARHEMQRTTVRAVTKELPPWLAEYNRKVQSGEVKHIGTKRREGGMSLQKRNELGNCPDQVLEKIKDLANQLGHTPSYDEFIYHYKSKYIHSIKYHHGSYLKAVEKAKLVSAKQLKEPDNEYLLKQLVDFNEKYGHIPMRSDFERGLLPSRQMYWRRFGSLNEARIQAGLNAVISMPFGQIQELTPEQYMEYKAGHRSPDAMKALRYRNRLKEAARNKGGGYE